jgi:hypothetical protein
MQVNFHLVDRGGFVFEVIEGPDGERTGASLTQANSLIQVSFMSWDVVDGQKTSKLDL